MNILLYLIPACILYLQKANRGDYDTIEIFECAKNNTNDQCKRMSYYYSTIDDCVNVIDEGMLHDTSLTDSTALINSVKDLVCIDNPDSYYNINSIADTEQQVVNSESDEPVFVDPGVEEDGIYSWLKSRKISTYNMTIFYTTKYLYVERTML